MTRAFSIAVVLSMLAVCVPSSLAWAEEGQINSCEILADWDQQWDFSGDGGSELSLVHRYRVVFDPPLSDSISHEELNTSVEHTRGSFSIIWTKHLDIRGWR